ncbi:acetate kinase [Intrasporangium oryzae NRRL B-24470]|uniref:Acetate kinase n=1 Tax=Intrasporangium oryzae NRRL B-24470 TaxID=1386089 RepID=W9G6C4_9MICO|nr:acetate kinase [Intrasporangium oryzae]EWT01545.1 acetate kinase [Intrasporangium oryzae NRRL B-24470]
MSGHLAGTDAGLPVLVLNAGSSSLKYQLLVPETSHVQASGIVERIGEPGSDVPDHRAAITVMSERLREEGIDVDALKPRAVGHRVVHGGSTFSDPVVIDDDVVARIRELVPLAPLHNPGAVTGIEAARARFDVPHVAVFDTAFFATLPAEAATYAIPRDLARQHRIRRYGFHGTSHHFVSRAAAELVARPVEELNQVVLHLGNGCSASAIRGGRAVETSMGMTPLEGLVMGTRSGDVDPGLHAFLHRELGMSLVEIDRLLNSESGLRGLAGVNDFRAIEERIEQGDADAQQAFDVFVHRLRHYVGAYMAQLGRLDVLSFTAGIGQHSARVRAAVVGGLEHFGLSIDPQRNATRSSDARVISPEGSPVTVAVVPTNEELSIARQAAALCRETEPA